MEPLDSLGLLTTDHQAGRGDDAQVQGTRPSNATTLPHLLPARVRHTPCVHLDVARQWVCPHTSNHLTRLREVVPPVHPVPPGLRSAASAPSAVQRAVPVHHTVGRSSSASWRLPRTRTSWSRARRRSSLSRRSCACCRRRRRSTTRARVRAPRLSEPCSHQPACPIKRAGVPLLPTLPRT